MRYLTPIFLCLLLALSLDSAANPGQQKGSEKPDLSGGIFTQKCTGCHDLTMVEEAHKTKTNAEMRETLKGHRLKDGFAIPEQDMETLLKLY